MIQLRCPEQFARTAERAARKRQFVRRLETNLYEIINIRKGHSHHVRIIRQSGALFCSCTCSAGLRHGRHPLVCKHLAAVMIFLRGIQQMRREH